MRSTNCKETRRAVEAYVMDEVAAVLDRCGAVDALRPVDEALRIMRDEVRYQTAQVGDRSIMGAGLARKYRDAGRIVQSAVADDPYNVWSLEAASGCFEAYNDAVRECIEEWLDETPEESARYDNERVWNLYIHLSAKAFERLHERENTPHNVKTSEFVRLYRTRNGGHFFDRATLKYWGQTMKDFSVEAFHLVTDNAGAVHDCYKVLDTIRLDGIKETHVHYFDQETLEEIYPAIDNEEA